MDIVVRSDQPVEVTGQGTDPKILQAGQSMTFTGVENIAVKAADPSQIAPAPVTDDVFAATNRPNGLVTAGIAPKMPKSSGELVQHPVGQNAVIERTAGVDPGQATQGGGPDAEVGQGEFKTPGPQPDQSGEGSGGLGTLGAATGDTGAKGEPAPREQSKRGDKPRGSGQKSGGSKKGGGQKSGSKKGR